MCSKVLVPLDGSPLSELALPYAGEMVKRFGSQVVLAYVVPAIDKWYIVHWRYLEEMGKIVKWGLKRNPDKPGVEEAKLDIRVLTGHPAEEIVKYADQSGIDLILMATHGHSGIKRWALGSVADEVVKTANQPVLLIKANDNHRVARQRIAFSKMIVPLDGSENGEAVLPYVKELARKLGTEVILLRVVPTAYQACTLGGYGFDAYPEQLIKIDESIARSYLEALSARLRGEDVRVKTEVRLGAAAEEILRVTKEKGADMVAMSTHGRSGVKRWIFGSVANRILHAGDTPLLLVKAAEATREHAGALEQLAGVNI